MLPKQPACRFEVCNKLLTKREISKMIDDVYRGLRSEGDGHFLRPDHGLGFYNAFKAGISFGKDDMVIPETKEKLVAETRELAKEYEQQYIDGLITKGEKYNKVVDAWAKCTDKVADEMMAVFRLSSSTRDQAREAGELDLHDGPLRRAWFPGPDEAACRHARPDGQAVRRDHRDADHLELQGRPDRSGVLQLHSWRP